MPPLKESYSMWSDLLMEDLLFTKIYNLYKLCLPNQVIFNNPHNSGDFTNRCTIKLENSYSIFLRTICFGKEDGLFLFLPRAFPVSSMLLLGLLLTLSAGVAKGEMSLISTGGGDQLSFSVVLKRRYSSKNKNTII